MKNLTKNIQSGYSITGFHMIGKNHLAGLVFWCLAFTIIFLDVSVEASGWYMQTVDENAGGSFPYPSVVLDEQGHPRIAYSSGYPNYELRYATWNGCAWDIMVVDRNINIFEDKVSLKVDTNGIPHITYSEEIPQATNASRLKYAYWTGAEWNIQVVDETPTGVLGEVGRVHSLDLDSNNYPHISYYYLLNLKYTYWNGSSWIMQIIEPNCYPGGISMALDNNDDPHICYYQTQLEDLKYAKKNGTSWLIQTIDSTDVVGRYPSLALDSLNQPHVSYEDRTNYHLKYARYDGAQWQVEAADNTYKVGAWTSLAIDADDRPHISYQDTDHNNLRYAYFNGTVWNIETVDTRNVGYCTSLAISSNGDKHIVYYNNREYILKCASLYTQPTLMVEADTEVLYFFEGEYTKEKTISIKNAGPDVVHWQIEEDCDWMEVTPLSGDCAEDTETVTITINADNLPGGYHTGTITISDDMAFNSPVNIEIKIYVGMTLNVPNVFNTIQAAIDYSSNGNTIVVEPGVYSENINFKGKNIILTSTDPDDPEVVANTVIQGSGSGSVVTFAGGEGVSCQLVGFTITGGAGVTLGGGIVGNNSNTNPTISQCVITGNSTTSAGGGIWGCGGKISRCVFAINSSNYGGGVAVCNGTIVNCLFQNNQAGYGGAINNCDGNIINCTITQNTGTSQGAVNGCDGQIINCIVWGNTPDTITNNTSVITNSCWPGGASGTSNINSNPSFVSSTSFRLQSNSPCIDRGTNSPAGITEYADLAGAVRCGDGNGDGMAVTDMGAYEYSSTEPVLSVEPGCLYFTAEALDAALPDRILYIRNTGIGILTWQINEDCTWLEVTPLTGESRGDLQGATVHVVTEGLDYGEYSCDLTITGDQADNSPQAVPIVLRIEEPEEPEIRDIIYVPGDYATIQAAINAAVTGDTIIVAAGTYTQNINFNGKNIILRSTNPDDADIVATTVIQGTGTTQAVTFSGSESQDCHLSGLTIRGGYSTSSGGGIKGNNTNATVSQCLIMNNQAAFGGGIHGIWKGKIDRCIITNNTATTGGAALGACMDAKVSNCLIYGNTTNNSQYGAVHSCNGPITNCTIAVNTGWGIGNCGGAITNCIIWGNSLGQILSNVQYPTYSCIQDGNTENGNINQEPLFVSGSDFHLDPESPCIDAGTNTPSVGLDSLDLGGLARLLDGDGDMTAVVDMGAYEYPVHPYIATSESQLVFFTSIDQGNPSEQGFTVRNIGGGTLVWQISTDCDWVDITPASGESLGESDEVVVSIDITGLARGVHTCQLTISDPAAENDPQTVEVELWLAGEIYVPEDYTTIQGAIDAAMEEDVIVVSPGTYNENIDYKGKAITVRSEDPSDWDIINSTIIKSKTSGQYLSCVSFYHNEGPDSVLEGVTLTDGRGANITYYYSYNSTGYGCQNPGGGIFCLDSSPTIHRCMIADNGGERASSRKVYYGGGIALLGNCQAVISNCYIFDNFADSSGCAIFIRSDNTPGATTPTIQNCTIMNNITYNSNNTNMAAVDCLNTRPVITNTIISSNGFYYSMMYYYGEVLLTDPTLVSYSCINGKVLTTLLGSTTFNISSINGNISVYPEFIQFGSGCIERAYNPGTGQWDCVERVERDLHLRYDSPCRNAGDPGYSLAAGDRDIDGQNRIMGSRVDMGADEIPPVIIVTYPAGGEVWAAGSEHEIRWITQDVIGTVDLAYSTDGGGSWQAIEANAANVGSYRWTLPEEDSANCLVAVTASTPDPEIEYTQLAVPFTIHPSPAGEAVEALWETQDRDVRRRGQAEFIGPELGCVKWQRAMGSAVTVSLVVGAGGNIHAACEDGKIYALDPNGAEVWQYETGSRLAGTPSVGQDGSIYFGAENGMIYALDKMGNLRWTHKTASLIASSPAVGENGNVYVAGQDGTLYALGADGSELWTFTVPNVGTIAGSLLVSPSIGLDGRIYVGALYQSTLYALNPGDGSVAWYNNTLPGKGIFAAPVVGADGTIYLNTLDDPKLHALNPANGAVVWAVNLADYAGGWFEGGAESLGTCAYTEPAVGPDGTIYVSFDDPYLRAVNPEGTIRWVKRLGMVGGFTLTAGSDGRVYAAGDDGGLYVVSPQGQELARFSPGEGRHYLSYPVMAAEGVVYLSDAQDTVWALAAECGEGAAKDLHRPWDPDGSGFTDLADVALLSAAWQECSDPYLSSCGYGEGPAYRGGDVNRDYFVDMEDLVELAAMWLES